MKGISYPQHQVPKCWPSDAQCADCGAPLCSRKPPLPWGRARMLHSASRLPRQPCVCVSGGRIWPRATTSSQPLWWGWTVWWWTFAPGELHHYQKTLTV